MTNPSPDPTLRFSDRVEDYIRYRPSYPVQVIDVLEQDCGLTPEAVIADIGSGTGILSTLLLAKGNVVFGVEPNLEMRSAAQRLLHAYPGFRSINGTAEATGLAASSIDLIVAAQAFHWFDAPRARDEFSRVLRPDGWVALVWNQRRHSAVGFLAAYEELLQASAGDYKAVRERRFDPDAIGAFYAPGKFKTAHFENHQDFDYEGLKGRLLSSSYAPREGQPGHDAMIENLRRVFDTHQQSGSVRFEYDTVVYYGRLIPRR